MKKILAVILAVLMLSAMSCVVYAINVRWYDPNCSHANTHIETYDYYYDCGEEIHKYVYGYNMFVQAVAILFIGKTRMVPHIPMVKMAIAIVVGGMV